ncbi:phosphoglycerate dehydrogenase-like enzyme [Scopulibacillus darangshiensis]|uniref:Phosphoglycerate dehydrogenase-like enzyme n=1 Tax=Scopulibacillus darangshiensis TaxID=442528 RepID=A0A4R2NQ04_9BACL|nr:hydroxyacid dehydrogenase [Scopulibacillus darangshiensis]TCP23521.1 phosphoglycerate dehydrogenase-like enzyme [Scopulibacillus darangshiensis]
MIKGLYVMNRGWFDKVYPQEVRKEIEKSAMIDVPLQTKESITENLSILRDAEVMFSGWGAPKLDERFLEAAPHLKALFYAAGSVKGVVTDACWERNIMVSSAYAANSIPVAEYTLSQILFSLKHGWHYSMAIKRKEKFVDKSSDCAPGGYGSTVGLISLGMVGRKVCELLKNYDIHVIAYDPYVSKEKAAELGVELCSLDEAFERSDIVSLHAPWLKETEGMITAAHFERMKPYATFINTARGAIVREPEMIRVLQRRTDLMAILDVTYPEPPKPGSPLYTLSNVILTPHIAGSGVNEAQRMGAYMLDEFKRYLKGEPLNWQITKGNVATLA